MDLASAVIVAYIAPPVMFVSLAIVKKIRNAIVGKMKSSVQGEADGLMTHPLR